MASREIKFRAWIPDNYAPGLKGMIYDYTDKNVFRIAGFDSKHVKVMQFTGLKDGKRTKEFPEGQEIYDGDIVRTPATPHLTCDYLVGVVEWSQDMFSNWYAEYYVNWHGRRETHNSSFHELEKSKLFPLTVIGNIYENPELLEKHGL